MDAAPPASFRADERPDVSVVLISYNTAHLIDRLFVTLEAARGLLRLQLIVVDNASRDGSTDIFRTKYPNVYLIENAANVGFGRANNQAMLKAQGRYVLLLNTDAFVAPDTLQKTVSFMDANPSCGVLGVKLVGSDGSIQPCCRYFPTPWNIFLASTGLSKFFPSTRLVDDWSWDHASLRKCDWVPGCYYLVRQEVIDHVGLFDPRYFLYYEEVDHCMAVRRAQWSVIYYPFTEVVHLGGESALSEGPLTVAGRQLLGLRIESELLFFRKHYGISGVLAAAFLKLAGNTIQAFKSLIRHWDTATAATEIQSSWTVLKLLAKTKLASRPTR